MVQRGYKAWCERIAEQYRSKLGLAKIAPLCAWKLAEHLKVKVWMIDEIPGLPKETLAHLVGPGQSMWSAATLLHKEEVLVILNSSHSKARLSNDLMHELAHLICGHKPARVDITEDGLMILRSYDKNQEDEADLLGHILLLPRVALVHIKSRGMTIKNAAKEYEVSEQLMTMRLNTSGVNKQFKYKSY